MQRQGMGLDGVLPFDRGFSDPRQRLSYVGAGSLGGKASGLGFIQELLTSEFDAALFPDIDVGVPRLTVLLTSVFDEFIRRNGLRDVADGDASDTYIAYAFQKADLPAEFLGDLRALVEHVHTPLAVRSSSLLEDARDEPFAGVYGTKMIPNNQESADERFRRLMEAIKFVYASTFFGGARGYLRATRHRPSDERMAVIIQEVVGARFGDRFYPALSGVARSFNYYPQGRARPADGVASLALGLGKTIVDGDACWTYALEYPRIAPPFSSAEDTFRETQTRFWAVNMAKPPAYDPIHETEYLMKSDLGDAEQDGTLRFIASTYDAQSGSISLGTGKAGPRVLTFAPLLTMNEIAVNDLVRNLVRLAERKLESPVEIEFAMTFNPHRFGFLQVRPMAVSDAAVTVSE